MNHNAVKVSIHLCTYNRASFIEEAIQSILKQTFSNWELLILDDASTDNTQGLVTPFLSDPRIMYIKNPTNLGITKNRNKALSLSQGQYIAVLDSDDVWLEPTKLEKQVAFLEQHPDHALVGTNIHIIDEHGALLKKVQYAQNDASIRNRLLIKNQFCHSSVMYRKDLALQLSGYDENLMIWEDYDLWLRLGLTYKLANLPMISTAYRRHSNQSDSTKHRAALRFLSVIIAKYKNNYRHPLVAQLVQTLRILRG